VFKQYALFIHIFSIFMQFLSREEKMKNRHSKAKAKSLTRCVDDLSRHSLIVLFSGMPLSLVGLLSILSMMLSDFKRSPALVSMIYPPMLEYILMGLLITVAGALSLDVMEKLDVI
jgi:hypothetical protein